MKVESMKTNKGRAVPNQFIIYGDDGSIVFQSYNAVIVRRGDGAVTLDEQYWDYSNTTGKYRNMFLGETKKETQAKIDNGTYKLANLN